MVQDDQPQEVLNSSSSSSNNKNTTTQNNESTKNSNNNTNSNNNSRPASAGLRQQGPNKSASKRLQELNRATRGALATEQEELTRTRGSITTAAAKLASSSASSLAASKASTPGSTRSDKGGDGDSIHGSYGANGGSSSSSNFGTTATSGGYGYHGNHSTNFHSQKLSSTGLSNSNTSGNPAAAASSLAFKQKRTGGSTPVSSSSSNNKNNSDPMPEKSRYVIDMNSSTARAALGAALSSASASASSSSSVSATPLSDNKNSKAAAQSVAMASNNNNNSSSSGIASGIQQHYNHGYATQIDDSKSLRKVSHESPSTYEEQAAMSAAKRVTSSAASAAASNHNNNINNEGSAALAAALKARTVADEVVDKMDYRENKLDDSMLNPIHIPPGITVTAEPTAIVSPIPVRHLSPSFALHNNHATSDRRALSPVRPDIVGSTYKLSRTVSSQSYHRPHSTEPEVDLFLSRSWASRNSSAESLATETSTKDRNQRPGGQFLQPHDQPKRPSLEHRDSSPLPMRRSLDDRPEIRAAFKANMLVPHANTTAAPVPYNKHRLGLFRRHKHSHGSGHHHGHSHGHGHNSHGQQNEGESSSRNSATPVLRMTTMRKQHKKSIFNEDKPWKHHADAAELTDAERKRYEGLWATNKGIHIPFLEDTPQPSQYHDPADDVHGIVVRELWRRSRLSEDTLQRIWQLVDKSYDGTLDRDSFLVGMWLVDQCLYGRKLPVRLDSKVWSSVGRLNVKVKIGKHK